MSTKPEFKTDLISLIDHRESVAGEALIESVCTLFQGHGQEFAAVLDGSRFIGMVSRGHLGFLLGARFGFALFARQAVKEHLIEGTLSFRNDTPVMEVLDQTFSRLGNAFYNDIALTDAEDRFLGFITLPTLVRLQSRIVAEKHQRAQEQRAELELKNRQLYCSLNELRHSQGRYEALLNNAAFGVALLSNSGDIQACNRRVEAFLTHLPAGPQAPRNLSDGMSPRDRESFLAMLKGQERSAGAPAGEGEFTILTRDQGPRLFRFFTCWIVETGQICAQIHDVTQERALERRVAMQEKSRLFDTLVGGIAHELNNKLAPVIGYAELLTESLSGPGVQADWKGHCQAIGESANEAVKIISQLRQLSRPPAAEMGWCNLVDIGSDAGELLRYRFRATGVKLDFEFPETTVPVFADPSQVKQVLVNLFINAIDAMEKSPEKRLRLFVGSEGETAVLRVTDTGQGIEPRYLNRIFDPFFTTKGPDRGTGLGLGICLSIVKQHRGEISVASTQGIGSTFEVRLPLASEDVVSLPKHCRVSEVLNATATVRALPHSVVLVVDDEEYITALVQETLRRRLDWSVERAHSGKQAIRRIEETRFDLIITDVRMPDIDGMELFRWIQDRHPELARRTLFVTGDAGATSGNRELQALGPPVLPKPFTSDMLVNQVRSLLEGTGGT